MKITQIEHEAKFNACKRCVKNEEVKKVYISNFEKTHKWKNPFTGTKATCIWCDLKFEMDVLNQEVKGEN